VTDFGIASILCAISTAPDPVICARIFQDAIAAFDSDAFVCGEVDLRALQRTVFYVIHWPESWRKFYLESGLLRRDPLLDMLKGRHEPLTWTELRQAGKWASVGTQALQIIADYGWTEGLAVPIPRGDRRFGLVSLFFRGRGLAAHDKSLLAMLSRAFHERLRNLASEHGFACPPAGLTKREVDTLRLIALGSTDREAALKLGISTATAHEYFEKAKRKLKASTRAEAAAIAVSLGIVIP
jgi:DNA-binding CsgD family transcriptional regulator